MRWMEAEPVIATELRRRLPGPCCQFKNRMGSVQVTPTTGASPGDCRRVPDASTLTPLLEQVLTAMRATGTCPDPHGQHCQKHACKRTTYSTRQPNKTIQDRRQKETNYQSCEIGQVSRSAYSLCNIHRSISLSTRSNRHSDTSNEPRVMHAGRRQQVPMAADRLSGASALSGSG